MGWWSTETVLVTLLKYLVIDFPLFEVVKFWIIDKYVMGKWKREILFHLQLSSGLIRHNFVHILVEILSYEISFVNQLWGIM